LSLARYAAIAVVLVLAGGSMAWLNRRPAPVRRPPPAPRVRLAGQLLPRGGDPVADALDRVRRYAQRPLLLQLPGGRVRRLSVARLGAEIDRAHLAEVVRAAFDPQRASSRFVQQHGGDTADRTLDLPVPIRIDTARALAALLAIKREVDRPPTDAVVDLEARRLLPDRPGYRLDVYGTLARVDEAVARGSSEVRAVGQTVAPRVVASALGQVQFDEVLGWYETRYSRAARHRARTYNLRLAASRLDGTVLPAGAVFDFNETVGPRDEAHGYKVAPVIAQGELVDGIGGGTCQISGTLHAAVFFAGLDVVERAPHTRPSSYILLGLDATVAYPTINFRFKNNFDFPVVVHETVKAGVVRAEILGPHRRRTVTLFRRIDKVLPFDELERETDRLPRGKRLLQQRGVPGFETTVMRVVRDGAYAVREKRVNVYPPTTQIVAVGTGESHAKGKIKEDRHPMYRAAEYLALTQGPALHTPGKTGAEPGGGMTENRVSGRTGGRDWQRKAGMKVFEAEEAGAGGGAG